MIKEKKQIRKIARNQAQLLGLDPDLKVMMPNFSDSGMSLQPTWKMFLVSAYFCYWSNQEI